MGKQSSVSLWEPQVLQQHVLPPRENAEWLQAGRRNRNRRRRSKSCKPGPPFTKAMWWNARGLNDKFAEATTYMELHGISVAGFCETRTYGSIKSTARWRYISGIEWRLVLNLLPHA